MNVFTAIGIATVIIIVACIIMNNFYHKKYVTMVSQGQADVNAAQTRIDGSITDLKKITALLSSATRS